jgi:hypothetical protein
LNDLLYVSLSADWLWLATILYICIDRPTPIAKLTSPLAISRLKSDQIQWTRDNNRENGEQDFFNNRQISRPLSSSSAGFIGDAFEKLPSIFDNIFSLYCLVRVCTFDVIVWQHDGDDMQWKRKENFFFFYIVGFQCLCSCVTAGGWSRERNSSKRFLSFPLKKKKILPSGVLFFTLQDTQCRAFRYFYSDFLYPKTRTQSLTILPTNPWRDDIKNCPARNGSKNLFFFFAYSNRIQREENWLKPN